MINTEDYNLIEMSSDLKKLCSHIAYQHTEYLCKHKIEGEFTLELSARGGDLIVTITKKNTVKHWVSKLLNFIIGY